MRKPILAALLGILACGTAMADKWVMLGYQKTEIAFANVSDIKNAGDYTFTWIASVNIDPKLPYDLDLQRLKINCTEGSLQVQASYRYLRGKMINNIYNESRLIYPPPNTVGDEAIEAICSQKEKRASFITDGLVADVPKLQNVLRKLTTQ